MELPHMINSERYLERIGGTDLEIEDTEMEEALDRINRPMHEVMYGEEGEVSMPVGELEVHFTYSRLNYAAEKQIREELWGEGFVDDEEFNAQNWRVVDTMEFITPEGKINLTGAIPSEYKIFFDPNATKLAGVIYFTSHNIYIAGDLAAPRSIATLMHEIGHIWDKQNLDQHGVTQFMSDSQHGHEAEKVRRERAATAFAFKQMKPYMKGQLKDDVIKFLKFYGLRSYYDHVKESISHQRTVTDYWEPDKFGEDDLLADHLWRNNFDKWKKTEAYQAWRTDPRYIDLDEFDEYVKWREWLELSKYDFAEDLPEQ